MPVLAVCRGSQVLNVARGGDLVQHLPDVVGDEKHKHTPGVFADHEVEVKEGTRLGSLLGERAPGQVAPPSGLRDDRRRARRVGVGRRRDARGDRGSRQALHRRRPLAPGGRRGRGPLPRARRRGAGVPGGEGLAGDRRRQRRRSRRLPGSRDGAKAGRGRLEGGWVERLRRGVDLRRDHRSRRWRLRERRRGRRSLGGRGRTGSERGQQLPHPGVVLGDPLLELELQARLLGHPLVELAPRVADHVADQDADDETAEEGGEPVAGGDRPGGAERAERDRADDDTRERADRHACAADRARLRLVVRDELLDGFL